MTSADESTLSHWSLLLASPGLYFIADQILDDLGERDLAAVERTSHVKK